MMSLSGCVTATFDSRACPPVKTYSKEEQNKFLNDLPKAPPSIQGLMVDYGVLRDKAKACARAG